MRRVISCIFMAAMAVLISPSLFGQQATTDRIESLKVRLEATALDIPNLHNKVSVTISGVSLYEFLRGIAIDNKINVNIDPSLDTPITINFTDVTITDLLAYICQQYNAEVLLTGNNILSIVKDYPVKAEPVAPIAKELKITFDS